MDIVAEKYIIMIKNTLSVFGTFSMHFKAFYSQRFQTHKKIKSDELIENYQNVMQITFTLI